MAGGADRSRSDAVDCLDDSASLVSTAPVGNYINYIVTDCAPDCAPRVDRFLISIFRISSFGMREP
jgi:hypothetical protein